MLSCLFIKEYPHFNSLSAGSPTSLDTGLSIELQLGVSDTHIPAPPSLAHRVLSSSPFMGLAF